MVMNLWRQWNGDMMEAGGGGVGFSFGWSGMTSLGKWHLSRELGDRKKPVLEGSIFGSQHSLYRIIQRGSLERRLPDIQACSAPAFWLHPDPVRHPAAFWVVESHARLLETAEWIVRGSQGLREQRGGENTDWGKENRASRRKQRCPKLFFFFNASASVRMITKLRQVWNV